MMKRVYRIVLYFGVVIGLWLLGAMFFQLSVRVDEFWVSALCAYAGAVCVGAFLMIPDPFELAEMDD